MALQVYSTTSTRTRRTWRSADRVPRCVGRATTFTGASRIHAGPPHTRSAIAKLPTRLVSEAATAIGQSTIIPDEPFPIERQPLRERPRVCGVHRDAPPATGWPALLPPCRSFYPHPAYPERGFRGNRHSADQDRVGRRQKLIERGRRPPVLAPARLVLPRLYRIAAEKQTRTNRNRTRIDTTRTGWQPADAPGAAGLSIGPGGPL